MLYLLPVPQTMKTTQSSFRLTLDTCIVLPPSPGMLIRTAANQLKAEIQFACGFEPSVTCGKAQPKDIQIILDNVKAQGYRLTINEHQVTLCGHDEKDLRDGVQTLRQIIRQSGWVLPGLDIEDAPQMQVRGYYYDQSRGRVNTLAWLKSLVDEACFYKINQMQLYVEHTYLFRDLPELCAAAITPLTAEDILSLDEYCAQRGIELIPSLASFGHMLEILRMKRFAPLSELENAQNYESTLYNRMAHHTIDPENDESFALVQTLLEEYMPLFRSNKFNICADETFDLGKGRNADKNVGTIYLRYLKKLCAYVQSCGKTPMFWGDIILENPEVLDKLPQDAICMNWCYRPDVTEDGTRAFAEVGAIQYACPGVSSWNRWMPDLNSAYENIRRMAQYGKKHGAVGLLNTDWGDYGHIADPSFSMPGLITGACAAWGELPPRETLWEAISALTYGDSTLRVVGLMANIADAEVSQWRYLVDYKDHVQGMSYDCPNKTLPMLDDAACAKADEQLEDAIKQLQSCALGIPQHMRPQLRNIIVCAQGIRYWNRVQVRICGGQRDEELADALMRWLHHYEAMWRETSRESELWRVRDAALWYAKQLQ